MSTCGCDPVGQKEIAEMLGVARVTVKMWHANDVLPPPRWYASGVPLWDRGDVAAWAAGRGRAVRA